MIEPFKVSFRFDHLNIFVGTLKHIFSIDNFCILAYIEPIYYIFFLFFLHQTLVNVIAER